MSSKSNIILASSFHSVASELREKGYLPERAVVAFIPTAGDLYEDRPWIDADRKGLEQLGYSLLDVDLKGMNAVDLKREIAQANIVFVAGGNTMYLAEQMHRSGFTEVVRWALEEGKMYIGSSAGAILAGPTVEPFMDEEQPELPKDFVLTNTACLGLVPYVILPHSPTFAEIDERITKKYKDRWQFVQLTDREYRLGRVE